LKLSKTPPWWDILEYVPIKKLKPKQIGMAGEKVLEKLDFQK